MSMDETTIKTNLGLILQSVLAKAIEAANITAIQDFQYDPTCEKPDFLVPDSKSPKFMVEVHQTEARNSFQMKTLRAFTAVTESKAFYGDNLVSVNVIFGDPVSELPESNLRALCCFFDVNVIPRKDASDIRAVAKLEKCALVFASDENYQKQTARAAKEVIAKNPTAMSSLSELMKLVFENSLARKELFPIWQAERIRASCLAKAPAAGFPTYHKRGLLSSLFLSDDQFAELISTESLDCCSAITKDLIHSLGLASLEEQIEGDKFTINPQFDQFLSDPQAAKYRGLCLDTLKHIPNVNCFFEDIRDYERRLKMATVFLREARKGPSEFRKSFSKTFRADVAFGIEHRRCWFADLMPLVVGKSHNFFNKSLYTNSRYTIALGNPYNNIAIRAPRLGSNTGALELLEELSCDLFFELLESEDIDLASMTPKLVANLLFRFRIDAAIKLRKLDPLFLVVADVASSHNLDLSVEGVDNSISDLANLGGVGQFRIAILSHPKQKKRVLINVVAAHDAHSDDKSKEWGARRLATLYRVRGGKVSISEFGDGIFVIDGEWEDKCIGRLHRCGWTHVCRLHELSATLTKIFGKPSSLRSKSVRSDSLAILEGSSDA